ncbi:hypothetical protein C9E82_12005 [Paracoccus siganidrum]|nr:hypothetical protein C9E82_12005 [Paracoccus siganidrum]
MHAKAADTHVTVLSGSSKRDAALAPHPQDQVAPQGTRDHPQHFRDIRVACFDRDPFASCLPMRTIMLRQNVEELIGRCFEWFVAGEDRKGEVVLVPPRLPVNAPVP